MEYNIDDTVIAKTNYIDLFIEKEEYVIYNIENIFGENLWYVSHNGKKITGWGLKKFELDIMFTKKADI